MTLHTREQSRREVVRRVQLGLAGLAGVLLLMALTNLVIENVRKDARGLATVDVTTPTINAAEPDESSEPLVDLGVTPAPESAVPDLEPDPRLRKPMDQDPRQPLR